MLLPLDHRIEKALSAPHWKAVGIKHHHGVCIPLFALCSKKSCGIGEFPDLIPMINWSARLGLDTIQLLPLNDTGMGISPYSAMSAFALNPLHLGLTSLDQVKDNPLLRKLKRLGNTRHIDYSQVMLLKERFLRLYFKEMFPILSLKKPYRHFLEEHSWLKGYAIFKSIKEKLGGRSWRQWPKQYKNREAIDAQLFKHELDYHQFVQYLCFRQWVLVKKKAEDKGVFLKGDIPILISTDSADVWQHRDLFYSDLTSGAPPDRYIPRGQNWQFPIYRWQDRFDDVLEWWLQRLDVASKLYHIYRLDHVQGLFRIWSIPKGKKAAEGKFTPGLKRKWLAQGNHILEELLNNCRMLPIGEDLGTVPKEVRESLLRLGIPGTKVIRWERDPEIGGPYIPLENYPPASMTTVSTHDTETLQQWWSKRPDESRPFATEMDLTYRKEMTAEQRKAILRASHRSESYFHINLLQEYFPLIPLFTWDRADDERINRPGRNVWKNWRYRYRPRVEEIISNPLLRETIRSIVERSTGT
ncbi:MAG: 4-alpha-glucanotransferase [Waddliaceae bacterium]